MKNKNQITVFRARETMDKFKMQAASEVISVGGQMVKKIPPYKLRKQVEMTDMHPDIKLSLLTIQN